MHERPGLLPDSAVKELGTDVLLGINPLSGSGLSTATLAGQAKRFSPECLLVFAPFAGQRSVTFCCSIKEESHINLLSIVARIPQNPTLVFIRFNYPIQYRIEVGFITWFNMVVNEHQISILNQLSIFYQINFG